MYAVEKTNKQTMYQEEANVTSTQQSIETGTTAQPSENILPSQQSSSAVSEQPANVPSALQPENPMPDSNASQQTNSVKDEPESIEEQEKQQENGLENEEDKKQTPKINCPEKIVLCFDLSSELNEKITLRQNQKDSKTVFHHLKKAMELFVKHKLRFNKKHQIAVLTFEKDAVWVQDFSGDVNLISDTLDNIRANPTDPFPQFDMMSLLQTIESHVHLPESSYLLDIPPDYLVRVLLIYGRSHSDIPNLSVEAKQIFDQYISRPHFFLDVLYVHELPDENNKCEEVYDALCKLDENEDCFVLEASTHGAARLYECTAKLLAHPLQRPKQQDIEYRIVKKESSDEETEPA